MLADLQRSFHASRFIFAGSILAALAAAVNVHFILRVGISVSHLTGDVSRLSAEFVLRPDISIEALRLFLSICGFVVGAGLSGFIIHHPSVTLNRPYGRAVIGIGLTMALAWYVERYAPTIAYPLAAAACGFQNALATRYRGIVIRTTHITGLLTDFGQLIGMKLAGNNIEPWKPLMHALLAGAFIVGSVLGVAMDMIFRQNTLIVIAVAYVITGVVWTILKHGLHADTHPT